MANSFLTAPPGTYPPSYSATVTPIASRSSYASVVSGTAVASRPLFQPPPRPDFFSQITTHISQNGLASLQDFPHSAYSHPYYRTSDSSHTASGGLSQASDHCENRHMQHYLSPFGIGGEVNAGSMFDHRTADFFVPSYLRGSKHVERLEEKYKARISAQRDGRSGRSSTGGSLSTSASSMSLPKMVPSHRGMTYDIQEKHFSHAGDIAPPLPSRWSMLDKFAGLEVIGEGLEIRYGSSNKGTDEAATVRSDYPVPKQCGIYYFEVTILNKSKDCFVGIGLCGPKVILNKIPGWELESWAYHGENGYTFCETASGKPYGPKYATSDVVGCGINFATGSIFFTKNGVHLGPAFKEVKTEILHPTVGMKRPGEHIRVNFGQNPFVYDIDTLVLRDKQALLEEVAKEDFSSLGPDHDEATFLPQLVAQYLAHEGFRETAKLFNGEVKQSSALLRGSESAPQTANHDEDLDAINRHRIRTAILDGDIDLALKHTKAYYPTVLQENENIYFKLRCRKFVEMIRKCTLLQPRSERPSIHGTTSSDAMNGHRKSMHEDYSDVFDGRMELDDNEPVSHHDYESQEHMDDKMSFDNITKQNDLMNQALQYGQELRAEFKDDIRRETRKELEDTFALIAYPDARESSLAPLLEASGRIPVAEELSSAILVSLGKSPTAALERLVQQTEVLVSDLGHSGGSAALLNVRNDYMR